MTTEELVEKLRFCAAGKCTERECGAENCWDNLMYEAADAIEELQKVANKLLAKYQEKATSVIWEYSGNIDESLDCLSEEVRTLTAQINGMPLPTPPRGEEVQE